MKIADTSGEWFMNMGMYRLVDADSGTMFDPGEPTKAKATKWLVGTPNPNAKEREKVPMIGGQPCIKAIDSPENPDVIKEGEEIKAAAKLNREGPPQDDSANPKA